MREARREALIQNWRLAEYRHSTSRFRDKVPGGFRQASDLPDWKHQESERKKLEEKKKTLGSISSNFVREIEPQNPSDEITLDNWQRHIETQEIPQEKASQAATNRSKWKSSWFYRFFVERIIILYAYTPYLKR